MARARSSAPAALLDRVDDPLLDEVERAVRASSALPLAKLTRRKLTPEAQGALLLRLEERGLQRFGKGVRVPLEAQILALVQGGPGCRSRISASG